MLMLAAACSVQPNASARSVGASSAGAATSLSLSQAQTSGEAPRVLHPAQGPDVLQVLTDPGTLDFAASPDGYYELMGNSAGSVNILYTSYEDRQTAFLCDEPDCEHDQAGCSSLVEDSVGAGKLFLSADNKTLYMITPDILSLDVGSSLLAMDTNGENRREICTFSPDEALGDIVAGDGTHLYFCVRVQEKLVRQEIRRIELETGESETLLHLGEAAALMGAYEGTLVLWRLNAALGATSGEHLYTRYNIEAQEETEILRYSFDLSSQEAQTASVAVWQNKLYLLEATGEGTADIIQLDCETGDREMLAEKLPYYSMETCFLGPVIAGQLPIRITDNKGGAGETEHTMFYLDLFDGQLHENRIVYEQNPQNGFFVTIAANAGEYYLVQRGENNLLYWMIEDVGETYASTVTKPEYALMRKEDFKAGEEAYLSIHDPVQTQVAV